MSTDTGLIKYGDSQLQQLNHHFNAGNYNLAKNYAKEVLALCEVFTELDGELKPPTPPKGRYE